MVALTQPLDLSGLQVFHTTDPLLSNGPVLVLYGPAAAPTSHTPASSRTQCHVFTAAGFQSFPRLIVSPSSTLYAAVNCLPREDQGDEICRALAFALLKYFTELPEVAKSSWIQQSLSSTTRNPNTLNLWSDSHAADLASRMMPVDDPATVIRQIESALSAQSVSYLDIDLLLPHGSFSQPPQVHNTLGRDDLLDADFDRRYGDFGPLVKLFGDTAFLPTSRIRRAPSKPTALNRSATFTRSQKDNMRREMSEFAATETRYVEKLSDLVNNVATSFRSKAQQRPFASSSPDEKALETLFPTSLNEILQVNTDFSKALQKILDTTAPAATSDIESTSDSSLVLNGQSLTSAVDQTGAVAFANLLLEWFPRFAGCYTDYIQKHSQFGPFLKTHSSNTQSTFAARVQETGEQRLTSMLIEPVQRLPRYSLYVDNIIKQLPIRHPALKSFLKAKDIISEICSQDGSVSPLSKSSRLKQIIPSWPSNFSPQGRFILAVDAVELRPPYEKDSTGAGSQDFLIILLAGHVVLLKKLGDSPMSARSFTAEVENSDVLPQPSVAGDGKSDNGLLFSNWMALKDVNFYESRSDCLIKLIPSKPRTADAIRSPQDGSIRNFLLKGAYEGRVSRWTKEVVRSRVEGRFTEAERDGDAWEVRSVDAERHGLGLFTAIYEDGPSQYAAGRGEPAPVRVVMSHAREGKSFNARQSGVDIVASVSPKGEGFFWLEIEAVNEKGTRDLTTEIDFLPILTKRLGNLIQMRSQIRNPVLTIYLLQHNSTILNALNLAAEGRNNYVNNPEPQAARPASPVKLLSNLFGSRSFKGQGSTRAEKSSTPALSKIPNFLPPGRSTTVPSTGNAEQETAPTMSMVSLLGGGNQDTPIDPFQALEQTLSCYLLALRARKGNIVGAVVARRIMADEAAVNELYNILLENPDNHERAAQASVDLLFAAFEKFLKAAWREKLGPVIGSSVLSEMQTKIEVLNPFDYDEYTENKLCELAPQNRRAFAEIVGLLTHLLDGTRNDGDRGALTAAFAEIVVCDGDPHAFIPMFDRLVEDHDVLISERPSSQANSSGFASTASSMTRSTKTGSISSKASSLSRRLGFGTLRRENSKAESPTGGSGLKFNTRKPLPPEPTPEKPGLRRPKSTDLTSQLTALRRPGSRDRPLVVGASDGSRPGTAHSIEAPATTLSSNENSPMRRNGTFRRKRRSSLSDLTTLQTPGASPFWTASASKQVEGIFQPSSTSRSPLLNNALPDTPSRTMSARQVSPNKKENLVPSSQGAYTAEEAKLGAAKVVEISPLRISKVSQSSGTSRSPGKTERPSSQDDTVPKGVLSERISSGNHPPPLNLSPSKTKENCSPAKQTEDSSPKKLRMQSPTKLRERLQTHQQAVEGANSTLQAELAKIGHEIAALNARPPPPPAKDDAPPSPPKPEVPAVAFNLSTRLKALETKVTHLTRNLADRSTVLENDLASSLQVADRRARKLDVELQRAAAENEALYARMNDETMKVFEQVRAGEGVAELRKQLKESYAEAAKWRGEAARLKRENVSLKARLDG